jgi:oxalate decarboxylase/phosphoglucose isomerase-like protein (cupin superfamily)
MRIHHRPVEGTPRVRVFSPSLGEPGFGPARLISHGLRGDAILACRVRLDDGETLIVPPYWVHADV